MLDMDEGLQDVERKCPKCGDFLIAGESRQARNTCACCGGLWVFQHTLEACIAEFLRQSGRDSRIVQFLERPGGRAHLSCADCGERMVAVNLRGVVVERCTPCRRLFLQAGDTALIARRVLISARTLIRRKPTIRRLPTDSPLPDPGRYEV